MSIKEQMKFSDEKYKPGDAGNKRNQATYAECRVLNYLLLLRKGTSESLWLVL